MYTIVWLVLSHILWQNCKPQGMMGRRGDKRHHLSPFPVFFQSSKVLIMLTIFLTRDEWEQVSSVLHVVMYYLTSASISFKTQTETRGSLDKPCDLKQPFKSHTGIYTLRCFWNFFWLICSSPCWRSRWSNLRVSVFRTISWEICSNTSSSLRSDH